MVGEDQIEREKESLGEGVEEKRGDDHEDRATVQEQSLLAPFQPQSAYRAARTHAEP